MKHKYIKIMTHIIVYSILLNSCKMQLKSLFDKDEIPLPKEDFTTSTTMNTEPTYEELLETIIESTIPETLESSDQIITEITPIIEETITPTEDTSTTIKENQVVTTKTNLNIRSGNTTDSMIIGNLNINDQAINLISYENNWCLIKSNDIIGFVSTEYLEPTSEIVESKYQYKEYKDIVLTTTDLNFRTEPTTESKIIRTFISSAIGSIYAIVSYMSILEIYSSLFLKIILSLTMVYIAFGSKSPKMFFKQLIIFYLTSFTFGGVAFAFLYFISPENILMEDRSTNRDIPNKSNSNSWNYRIYYNYNII